MGFSQQGSWTVCILSANGVICNVSLRQPAISGGTVTYEVWMNHFCACFLNLYVTVWAYNSIGMLWDNISVWFISVYWRRWNPEQNWWVECHSGRFRWPCSRWWCCWYVGGSNTCAGVSFFLFSSFLLQRKPQTHLVLFFVFPQVVLGSFNADQKRPKSNTEKHDSPMAPPPQVSAAGLGGGFNTSSPPSQGTVSESSDDGDTGSPLNNQGGGNRHNSGQQHVSNMSPYTSLGWPQVSPSLNNIHRHETDMKIMPNWPK